MQPIYVSKLLGAASSNGLGSISTAATPVITLNTSQMDTGRRVVFWSTAADTSSLTLTFTGYGESRSIAFSESVKGSTSGAGTLATTTSDFISLTAVSYSSAPNVAINIGTSTTGGTQWKLTNWHITPAMFSAAVTFSSTAAAATGTLELCVDDVTGTYLDPDKQSLVPDVFVSSAFSAVSSNTLAGLSIDTYGTGAPFAAWRLTVTSTSTSTTVYATVMQAGIG